MQIAWSNRAWPQLKPAEFLEILRGAGLSRWVHDLGNVEGREVGELLWPELEGLTLAAVSFSSTMAEAADLELAKAIVRMAQGRQAQVVNLHVLVAMQEFASLPDVLAGNLLRLADEAAAGGIKLCLDSSSGLGGSSRAIARTMNGLEHPALRLQFDPGAYVAQNPGSQVEIALQRLIGWVGSFRLADAVFGSAELDFPPLGQGAAVDFARLLQLVQAMELDVPCEVYFRPVTKRPATAPRIEQWLRESLRTLQDCGWRW